MGFFIRKGFNFGPFRLNLSRSGFGASVGVPGARIGLGPRGSYVHVGRGGLYYRQSLGPVGSRRSPASSTRPLDDIDSVDVSQLTASSASNLLAELNRVHRRVTLFPIGLLLIIALAIALAALPSVRDDPLLTDAPVESPDAHSSAEVLRNRLSQPKTHFPESWIYYFAAAGAAFAGIPLLVYLRRCDVALGRFTLTYALDGDAKEQFSALRDGFERLLSCEQVWHVSAQGATDDWKRNAGANMLMDRQPVSGGFASPSRVDCNVQIPMLPAGKETLYFMPDQILVYSRTGVGTVAYADLDVTVGATRFNETGKVPSDAQVVGSTWRFVAKSGGPDRRFNNNFEIPIALYGELRLRSRTGLNELFQCSNVEAPDAVARAVRQMARHSGATGHGVAATPTGHIPAGLTDLSDLLNNLNNKDPKELYVQAKRVYELIPTAYVLYCKGALAAQCGDYKAAERDLLAAYEGRNDPHAWLRDELQRLSKTFGTDLSTLQNTLNVAFPENQLIHNLAIVYFKTERFVDAKLWADRVLGDPEFRHQALKMVAGSEVHLGHFAEAFDSWQTFYRESHSDDDRGLGAFNAACCLGRLQQDADLPLWISRALESGYPADKIRSDEDLQGYISRPEILRILPPQNG